MSIFKPAKKPYKKELIDSALNDLDPSVRDKAREILENLDEEYLLDRDRVRELLRKRGIV